MTGSTTDQFRASGTPAPRRAVLVLAQHDARPAAPPGVAPDAFARAVLADGYEVAAGLVGVGHGVAGPPELAEVLWPGALHLPADRPAALAAALAGRLDELVLLPADVCDLPGLVVAQVLKVLHRADAVVAPSVTGGTVALGLRLPLAGWLAEQPLDLDDDLATTLTVAARAVPGGRRGQVLRSPGWHRLRRPADLDRLDPRLEGWDGTRMLLADAGLLGAPW